MSRKSKPTITADQVRRLANLSRLTLTSAQEEELRGELSSILDYFSTVDGVRDGIPLDSMTREAHALRPDEVGQSDPEGVARGVPQRKGRLVRAPKVF